MPASTSRTSSLCRLVLVLKNICFSWLRAVLMVTPRCSAASSREQPSQSSYTNSISALVSE